MKSRWYGDKMSRYVTSRAFSLRWWCLSDGKELVIQIAQMENTKESSKPLGVQRQTKRKSPDGKSNEKFLKGSQQMGDTLWFEIKGDHSHGCVEYSLKGIKCERWFRSWFLNMFSFCYIISCICLIRFNLSLVCIRTSLN